MEQSKYYSDYLQLDKILGAQHPESFKEGNEPAHDEMLFIIVHQAYELWFKQILFELDFIQSVFEKNKIDFLEFRNLLVPSSGFQSLQFRLVEAKLGLAMNARFRSDYYKRMNEGGFNKEDLEKINKAESEKTLLQLVNNWLERMPFFETEFWESYHKGNDDLHPFWSDYRKIYKNGLTEKEAANINDLDLVFFERKGNFTEEEIKQNKTLFSPAAMRAALFIMLYRDFPVFQTSYQVLDSLVEIDHQMSGWRYKHLVMVRRMIGLRSGTGGTSGSGYLEGALSRHFIFSDIERLSTFLIERKKLPKLPKELIKKLSYS